MPQGSRQETQRSKAGPGCVAREREEGTPEADTGGRLRKEYLCTQKRATAAEPQNAANLVR